MWVDRATFLLRKVEERRTLSTYRTLTTTLYDAELDAEVGEGDLAFPGIPPP